MSEFRTTIRYRTGRPAIIILKGAGTLKCTVRDLSTKGAGLELEEARKVPDEFLLLIQGQSEKYRCHVAWQKGAMIGVQYM
jgi:methyl-accepting chemotaxis protein